MRTAYLYMHLLVSILLIDPAVVLAGDPNDGVVRSVDRRKIEKYKYTLFIRHVFWPHEDRIAGRTISKREIPEDMQAFKNMLKKVMRPEYLPSEKVIDANAVAVENMRGPNDYILLKYNYDGGELRIQDGPALYIGVFPNKDIRVEQPELGNYVKSVALRILNLPKVGEKTKLHEIFVSVADIGQSKCGSMFYEERSLPPRFWYSYMKWWSDRKNVLFAIGKYLPNGEDLSTRAGPPEGLGDPRKFKKRGKPPK